MIRYKVYVMEFNEALQKYFVAEEHNDIVHYAAAKSIYDGLVAKYQNSEKYCEYKIKLTATEEIITYDYKVINMYDSTTLEIASNLYGAIDVK